MRDFLFHIAEGADDYNAVAKLLQQRFGNFDRDRSKQTLISNSIMSSSLIIMRDKACDGVLGATIIDLTSYEGSLFIPFILVDENHEHKGLVNRRLMELIIKALVIMDIKRILFMLEEDTKHARAIQEFNKLMKDEKLPVELDVIGTVRDMFGDGRTISVGQLFIPPDERPDLVSNVIEKTRNIVRSVGEIAKEQIILGCCSGCKEDKDGKEGKDGKDGSDAKEGSEISIGANQIMLDYYKQLNIYRFNRYYEPNHFVPLV